MEGEAIQGNGRSLTLDETLLERKAGLPFKRNRKRTWGFEKLLCKRRHLLTDVKGKWNYSQKVQKGRVGKVPNSHRKNAGAFQE